MVGLLFENEKSPGDWPGVGCELKRVSNILHRLEKSKPVYP
jgi:hypothetical protein